MNEQCCEDRGYQTNFMCDIQNNPFDCSDKIIISNKRDNKYGLIFHDGGSSNVEINFCPWCGSKL
ncbi:MAG: DUF6980 family protein [Bacillota bacterium]